MRHFFEKKQKQHMDDDITTYIDQPQKINAKTDALIIVLKYTMFGVLWILISDKALHMFIPDQSLYVKAQTYKGWLYVLVTGLLLYTLVFNRMNLLKKAIKRIVEGYENLAATNEEMIAAEDELYKQKEFTEKILENTPAIIVVWDSEGKIIRINSYGEKVSGYSIDELMNQPWTNYIRGKKKQAENVFESKLITKGGKEIDILWTISIVGSTYTQSSHTNYLNQTVAVGTDITEHKNFEKELQQLAYFDLLTGLPNRTMFEEELGNILQNRNDEVAFAFIYMDVDNFKYINDTLGHDAGDMFLQYISLALQGTIHAPDMVARFGGDEFAIILQDVSDREMIINRIKEIKRALGETWSFHHLEFYISLSIGIVVYPQDGNYATDLYKNADVAMFKAKKEGKNRYVFYVDDLQRESLQLVQMANQLQKAIERNELTLMYQPQFDLASNEIIGVEALVRWVHPEKGFISPMEFIPLAEETGQIYEIERWIISTALQQKRLWNRLGYPPIEMSINLSSKTITSDINFAEIKDILLSYEGKHSEIVIEITETAIISDVGSVIERLNNLRSSGIRIALDDFGTGFSSLTYLKSLPIDMVKLDRSFIGDIEKETRDSLIVKSILQLALNLSYQVVAEGIETHEQHQTLLVYGCMFGQGYLFSKPVTPEEIENKYLAQLKSI